MIKEPPFTALSIIFSLSVFAAEEEGTGGTPNNSSTTTVYQLVCATVIFDVSTNNNQTESQNCVLVAIQAEET